MGGPEGPQYVPVGLALNLLKVELARELPLDLRHTPS
jgi:hypothetical protein